ncbi:MAG: cobalamin-dependent protein [Pirellulales bacterium]|nr:cobalamin-dependent protein [Pirellulales bacterium]
MKNRVLLIYPPATKGEPGAGILTAKEAQCSFFSYGLLTLSTYLQDNGFEVEVINLATFTWQEAITAIRNRPADLFGISCYTFNRHTAAALGDEIKAMYPNAHVTVGGPHVSVLATQWLDHYPSTDTVVIGEGEHTLLDLAQRLAGGQPTTNIPGTAFRNNGSGPSIGPLRPPVADLDSLGKTWKYYRHNLTVSSRGCPGRCTFCGTPRLWGQRVRFRSAGHVLEEIEAYTQGHLQPLLRFGDDTITADKSRMLDICNGIVERRLDFVWPCNTRVDCVNRDVLLAMRRAGCTALCLGVESASPIILKNIRKQTNIEQIRSATAIGKELGMSVWYYIMMGNRGETAATVQETLDFLDEMQPPMVECSMPLIMPETEEFQIAKKKGYVNEEHFFTDHRDQFCMNFSERDPETIAALTKMAKKYHQVEAPFPSFSVAEREQILARHPDILLSYTDLAKSYIQEHRYADAEEVMASATTNLGREPSCYWHYRACIKFAMREISEAVRCFEHARNIAPDDKALIRNINALTAAGTMNPQQHVEVTATLMLNLTNDSIVTAGQPSLPAPLDS